MIAYKTLNINQLTGRIVGDIDFKETKSGKNLLTLNLMYFTKQSTDSDGSHSNFIQVEVWNNVASAMSTMLTIGMLILVNGAIVQKRWTDEGGKNRSQFVFSADSINIMQEQSEASDE